MTDLLTSPFIEALRAQRDARDQKQLPSEVDRALVEAALCADFDHILLETTP